MAPKFEETLVTNFKRPDRLAHQLSSSNTISTIILEIHINGPDLPLPTSVKSNHRYRRSFHQLCSPTGSDKQESRGHL